MLKSPCPLPFLKTYSLSISLLVCEALYTVISFLVHLSFCISSSLVHFKNGPEYLTIRTAQVYIPFIRFLLYSLVSSNFLVLLRYSFESFSFISTCLMVPVSNISMYLHASFSPCVQIFSWFGCSIHSVIYGYSFSLLAWRIFLFQIPSLWPDCIFPVTVHPNTGSEDYFSFFANSFLPFSL